MLQQVLGPGNVAVQISAEVDFDSREIHQEVFEPAEEGSGLVTNLQRVEEHFSGNSELPENVAGSDSNVPSYPSYGAGGESEYERTETTQDSVVNRITEMHTVAPGTVERLSVAVVVNDVLTEEETGMLQTVVSSALGSDPERRDQITVTGMPFDTSLADQLADEADGAAPSPPSGREIPPLYYAIAAAAFLLIALITTSLILRRSNEDYVLRNYI
ncbi:MAG: flagellar M-ring protein FliF C-terminal domain-containing protein [Planctomycetota bacterium]